MKRATFGEVVAVAQETQKGGVKLWNTLAACVMSMAASQFSAAKEQSDANKTPDLSSWFKEQEAAVKLEKDVNLNTIGAYRSTKSVINAAARYGVPIVEKNGEVRGKTEVEKEVADLRQPEAAIKTIERSFKAISGKLAGVTDPVEVRVAYALAANVLKMAQDHASKVLGVSGAVLTKTLAKETPAKLVASS